MSKEKGIVGKVIDDLIDHTKTQHEITKARHEASKVSPADAKAKFKAQHAHAKLSPAEKQKIQLEEIAAGNTTGNQILNKKK